MASYSWQGGTIYFSMGAFFLILPVPLSGSSTGEGCEDEEGL